MGKPAKYSGAVDAWPSAGIMAGGKAYASAPLGQMHYRDIGPRDARVPFLLLHQTWMSLVEFAEIQDALADLGYRSIAPDMPGHGMSDPAPHQPTIEELTQNLIPLLDGLGIGKVVLVGHHTGCAISAYFAAHYPDRVAAVVLHGAPMFPKAQLDVFLEKLLAAPTYDRTPQEDGSHVTRWFQRQFPGDPKPNTPENLRSRTWMLLSKYMMGPDIALYAVYNHDMQPDILAIRAPTLILTDASDPIHVADQNVAKLRPDFAYEVFSQHSGMAMMNEPRRWAKIVADFISRSI